MLGSLTNLYNSRQLTEIWITVLSLSSKRTDSHKTKWSTRCSTKVSKKGKNNLYHENTGFIIHAAFKPGPDRKWYKKEYSNQKQNTQAIEETRNNETHMSPGKWYEVPWAQRSIRKQGWKKQAKTRQGRFLSALWKDLGFVHDDLQKIDRARSNVQKQQINMFNDLGTMNMHE